MCAMFMCVYVTHMCCVLWFAAAADVHACICCCWNTTLHRQHWVLLCAAPAACILVCAWHHLDVSWLPMGRLLCLAVKRCGWNTIVPAVQLSQDVYYSVWMHARCSQLVAPVMVFTLYLGSMHAQLLAQMWDAVQLPYGEYVCGAKDAVYFYLSSPAWRLLYTSSDWS